MHLTEYNLRISKLLEFIALYNEYKESDIPELRNEVARKAKIISMYVKDADVGTFLIDGRKTPYDIFENIVNRNVITKEDVNDRVYSTIGVYEDRYARWKRKIINPLYWVGELIRVPFHLMKYAGFDIGKIELYWFSKVYKFIMAILAFISTILVILNYLGVSTNIQTKQIVPAANEKIASTVSEISGFKYKTITIAPIEAASKKHINPLTKRSSRRPNLICVS